MGGNFDPYRPFLVLPLCPRGIKRTMDYFSYTENVNDIVFSEGNVLHISITRNHIVSCKRYAYPYLLLVFHCFFV